MVAKCNLDEWHQESPYQHPWGETSSVAIARGHAVGSNSQSAGISRSVDREEGSACALVDLEVHVKSKLPGISMVLALPLQFVGVVVFIQLLLHDN